MATTSPPSSAQAPAAPALAVGLSARRRMLVWTLIVVASLLLVVSILTTWVNRQMLSNASWTSASSKVIADPAVQSALSAYVVNQLYENVDVAGSLRAQLPRNLKPLAGPVSAALREPSTNAVQFLLARPRLHRVFVTTSGVAHQKLVNVLENKTGHGIATGNGVVTLDLHQLVQQVGAELGVPAKALDRLPAGSGVITVMRSDQLSAAQKGVQLVRALSLWLLVAVLVLYGVAIYLARGHRRETLRTVGWSFVLVGLLALVARRVVGNYAIHALATPEYERPATHVWLIESSVLGDIGRAAILYGLIGVAGAVLAGPTRWATAARARIAPVLVDRPEIAWGAVAALFLLLVLWGGTHALRTWWGVLLLGALLAVGVAALQRQMRAERVAT